MVEKLPLPGGLRKKRGPRFAFYPTKEITKSDVAERLEMIALARRLDEAKKKLKPRYLRNESLSSAHDIVRGPRQR